MRSQVKWLYGNAPGLRPLTEQGCPSIFGATPGLVKMSYVPYLKIEE